MTEVTRLLQLRIGKYCRKFRLPIRFEIGVLVDYQILVGVGTFDLPEIESHQISLEVQLLKPPVEFELSQLSEGSTLLPELEEDWSTTPSLQKSNKIQQVEFFFFLSMIFINCYKRQV